MPAGSGDNRRMHDLYFDARSRYLFGVPRVYPNTVRKSDPSQPQACTDVSAVQPIARNERLQAPNGTVP